jgi:hypothetical protein
MGGLEFSGNPLVLTIAMIEPLALNKQHGQMFKRQHTF